MPIALDATYSLGKNLTGVGVYSREMLFGLAAAHPDEEFLWCYRSHRFLRSYRERIPRNVVRRLLVGAPPGELFHALNQRVDARAARTVATFHDLFVLTGEYSSPEFRARFAEQARLAAERSDLIIAVSRFTANQVEELLKIPAERIRVVHHGMRMPSLQNEHRDDLVLFVGAIQKRKNVARLIKAFGRLPSNWRLALAGSPEGYGAAEELAAVGSNARVEVLGYVAQDALEKLYRRARIFAFPSLDEGFGMPVLEAMAYGVPVVTSNRSAMPEVAGDAAILVDPFDVDEIADGLLRAVSQFDDFSRRGLERARQFSWDRAVKETWAIYDETR